MDAHRAIAVSPRHQVALASELWLLIERAPRQDFVVRTIARREANGLPLMSAELVIGSEETRQRHPAAATYPLHFRKTYFPGRLHRDPAEEYEHHLLASRLTSIPAPIGHDPTTFRSCLIPGQPYARLSPFGAEPPESNIARAEELALAAAAGLWRLAEQLLQQLLELHAGGLVHGDAELHNGVVSPSPLEAVLIDFEAAATRDEVPAATWEERRQADLRPLLREAIYLQCALGRQPGSLGELAREQLDQLFERGERFARAIEARAEV